MFRSFLPFKVLVGVLFSALISPLAYSDDGGVVGISVKDLQFSTSKWSSSTQKQVVTPVALDDFTTYQVDARGGEASKLMSILPSSLSVLTADPKFAKVYNANFRSLEITGKKGQPSATIYCEGGSVDFSGATPTFKAYPDGAHCSITVGTVSEDDNINYTFEPKKDLCGK